MMREILFRGKRKGNGEWIYGDLIHDWSDHNTKPVIKIYNNIGSFTVIPETVGQYTGLTDKNGKKIFEGDIVKCRHNWHNWNHSWGKDSFENDEEVFFAQKIRGAYGKHKSEEYAMFDKDRYFYYRNYAVEYYAKNGGYRARNGGQFHALTQSFIYNSDLEVIGNIHDNPELMKGATGYEKGR